MSTFETRFLGSCLALAGLIAAIAMPFHPNELAEGALLDSRWLPVHVGLLVAFTLSIPGLLGLWLVQRPLLARWGHGAFFLALVGCGLSVGMVALEVGAFPGIARTDPRPLMALMGPETPYWPSGLLFGTGFLTWIPGWMAVGVATATAGAFPRPLGVAITVCSAAVAVPIHFVGGGGEFLHALTGGAFGAAWLAAGLATVRGAADEAARAHIRAA
ncbi:MAG: hypothetical protein FJ102_06410 [Deltaproteobacteria bacterium]|nr:hypothetical protein [Deltaproteobacteria bacterium]